MAHEQSHHGHSDHGHSHDHASGHHHHDHAGGHIHGGGDKQRMLIAACLTGAFMVAEALAGFFVGSLALLADAGHMLTDSVSLGFAWYAFHLAGRPATSAHTYGFDRVKTLVAYSNGLAIFFIAAWIVVEAVGRFASPEKVLGVPMLIVAAVGFAVNVGIFFVLHGGDRENLNMRGAIIHVAGDLLGSLAAIVAAAVIIATGWYPIDPILSVLVAVVIFAAAGRLMRDAGRVLLEGVPRSIDRDEIARDLATNIRGVRGVHHVHVWSLDGSKNIATLHALLEDGADAYEATVAIKARLAHSHKIGHATVETEFGHCADGRVLH
ncbi:MAG: cation diffusion facilitator family transporter [Rhizobiaceae bacterium]